jgi:16S rRNA (guanine527-N7)-methyltransferase
LTEVFRLAHLEPTSGFLHGASQHLHNLYKWNAKQNLTAVSESEAAERHVLDSILPFVDLPAPDTLLDIGSGAGFPGVPVALWWPTTQVTLLEPRRKRRSFLESSCASLGLGCVVREERLEHLGAESWSMVTSRGTLPWADLLLRAPPYVRPGGLLVALLGPDVSPSAEVLDALLHHATAWQGLEKRAYTLPGGRKRVALHARRAP